MPIQQWLYFDAVECLPVNSLEVLSEADCQPVSGIFDYIVCCCTDAIDDSRMIV